MATAAFDPDGEWFKRLLTAITKGDSDAADRLLKPLTALLLSQAYRVTRNREDAKDAVEEAIFRFLCRLSRPSKDPFRPNQVKRWLVTSTIRLALKRKKPTQREVNVDSADDGNTIEDQFESSDAPPGQRIFSEQFWKDFARCWKEVSLPDKMIFAFHVSHWTQTSIAASLLFKGKSQRVHEHQNEVKKKVRECLKAKGHTNADDLWAA